VETDCDEDCGAFLERGQKRTVTSGEVMYPLANPLTVQCTEMKIVVKNGNPSRIESEIILAPFHSLFFPTDQALSFSVKGFCNDILFTFRVTVTQNSRGHG